MQDDRYESPDLERPHNEQPVYPSFLARAGAFLLDWAIVLVLAIFVAVGAGADVGARFVILLVLPAVYVIGFHLAIGATPGKMALRMHIADPAGQRLEPDRVILRYVVFFLTLPLIPINAFLVFADTPERRAIHDRVAGTRVLPGRPGWIDQER